MSRAKPVTTGDVASRISQIKELEKMRSKKRGEDYVKNLRRTLLEEYPNDRLKTITNLADFHQNKPAGEVLKKYKEGIENLSNAVQNCQKLFLDKSSKSNKELDDAIKEVEKASMDNGKLLASPANRELIKSAITEYRSDNEPHLSEPEKHYLWELNDLNTKERTERAHRNTLLGMLHITKPKNLGEALNIDDPDEELQCFYKDKNGKKHSLPKLSFKEHCALIAEWNADPKNADDPIPMPRKNWTNNGFTIKTGSDENAAAYGRMMEKYVRNRTDKSSSTITVQEQVQPAIPSGAITRADGAVATPSTPPLATPSGSTNP